MKDVCSAVLGWDNYIITIKRNTLYESKCSGKACVPILEVSTLVDRGGIRGCIWVRRI
jgi:hypothetical protein